MSEDILERLKSKELEMEEFLNEAGRKASAIKEDALRKAKEVRAVKTKEMERELSELAAHEREAALKEVESIEKEAVELAEKLKKKGEARKDKAVAEVVRFIIDGLGER
jgi:vacuolar-type H+-ATPase subunit H